MRERIDRGGDRSDMVSASDRGTDTVASRINGEEELLSIAARKTVVVVDDHPIVLAGIKALVQGSGDFELAGAAASGAEGLRLIEILKPDLAVVDLAMPGMNGVEVVKRIGTILPSTMVIVMTVHEEPTHVQQVLKAGGRGYVLKRSAADELVRALRAVVANGLYIDPAVAGKMLGSQSPVAETTPGLSEREREIIKAAARGYSNKETAARLDLSVKTIETYRGRAMDKLNFKTRAELVRYATAQGWLSEV